MSNILLMLAHSVEEFDQIRLLSEIDHSIFSLGGYINPHAPHDPKRPALPQVKHFPELQAIVDNLGTEDNLEAAKRHIPDGILDWADVIICHHHEGEWLIPQWNRIKHKRVIWRTVGQSIESNERAIAPLRKQGLEIVRYSPKERNIPGYLGENALIRFYKDPEEWNGWTGEIKQVINITQRLAARHPYTNLDFWRQSTTGLQARALGPGSADGEMTLEDMKAALRHSRAYLYTGTQPASYTLGLIEAMMTGIPVVSIGPAWMNVFPYGPELFEGHEIVANDRWSNSPGLVRNMLKALLDDPGLAKFHGDAQRTRAIELFGKEKIAGKWKAYLG